MTNVRITDRRLLVWAWRNDEVWHRREIGPRGRLFEGSARVIERLAGLGKSVAVVCALWIRSPWLLRFELPDHRVHGFRQGDRERVAGLLYCTCNRERLTMLVSSGRMSSGSRSLRPDSSVGNPRFLNTQAFQ